tara:strand:- start:82 stop:771 length:690 start_codon:yes stop_codon:yes gene_type:complete
MPYNYITLVNEVQRRLNEVELTSSTFTTARGFYALAKDAVNSSVRHINQEEFEWPWNHVEAEEILSAGIARYSYPYDAKTINMSTFRIKRSDSLNVTTIKLKTITYEEYLDKYVDIEYNSATSARSVPRLIARTPSREFVLYPSPDKSYALVYEYFTSTFDLIKEADVPTIPEQYRHVIIDGAMYYAYMFRSDAQAAGMTLEKFAQGIKNMRSLNINRIEYAADTRVYY